MAYRIKGSKKWKATIYVAGRRTTRTCPNKKAAELLEAQSGENQWRVRTGLASEADIVIADKCRRCPKAALEEHIAELERRGRSIAHCAERRRVCTRIIDGTSATSCIALKGDLIRAFIRQESEDKSSRTYNSLHAHIRALCRWLVRNQYLKESPVEGMQRAEDHFDANPTRVLTVNEVERLIGLGNERQLLYTFAFYTGFRWGAVGDGGECARLRFEWIDLAAGELRIPVAGITKNKKPVRVPLASTVIEALAAERRIGGHVFPTVPTLRTWKRDLVRAGIKLETPQGRAHRKATRKTFATRLGEAGVSNDLRARLMRHSDSMLVERRYTEKTDEMVAQERQALEQMVAHCRAKLRSESA